MALLHRPARAGVIGFLGLAMVAVTTAAGASHAGASPAGPSLVTIPGSLAKTTDSVTGAYQSPSMAVEVALAPQHAAQLSSELTAVYTEGSSQYHRWLAKGGFEARYAPAPAQRAAVAAYLRSQGLVVGPETSPFLVTATGASSKVASAFHTTLSTYRDPQGVSYFSNSAAVLLPSTVSGGVLGVIGLSNTVREHSMVQRVNNVSRPLGTSAKATSSCEAPYPTKAQLFAAVNDGVGFPFGYGGSPGCNGLTPSQTNSIYGAPKLGARAQGKGVDLAVFELSAYQKSDIDHWAHTFYGPGYTPKLDDVNIDGGPLHVDCPAGDSCPPAYEGYAGDIEVDADIENQLAVAPDAAKITVYNAPNDFTGQTELDEYTFIAHTDAAASISSSWASCENDVSAGYVQAENVVFEQMALQGQSMFGAEGDTGAFSCIRSDGTDIPNVLDPPSQPWVTSVGGTSLESDNPGTKANPSYPAGVETVWNVDDLCNTRAASSAEGGKTGFFWCGETGAGGGGSSQYWGRPFYQHGPGVNSSATTYGNGTTQCAFAKTGAPCREDPDISANADEYTPYAEYCTGNAHTPNSICAGITTDAPGWLGIGGTSLSSPLWSAIIADRDSYQGVRSGNVNPLLYQLAEFGQGKYLHDITSHGDITNNGLFRTTPGYDEATGLGTPKMAELITARL